MASEWRWHVLRLADYCPVRASRYERQCTLTEIAEAIALKAHDGATKVESIEKRR